MTTTPLPRCPVCSSGRVIREMGSTVKMRGAGNFTFTERTYDRCATCGHTWNRRAIQQGGTTTPTPSTGFLTRLFQRLFPFIK